MRHPEQYRGPLRQRLLRAQDLGFDTKMTTWTGIVGLLANLIVATVQCSTHCSAGCRTGMTRRPTDYEIEGPAEPTVVAPEQAHRAT